jgi:hypothetical protein
MLLAAVVSGGTNARLTRAKRQSARTKIDDGEQVGQTRPWETGGSLTDDFEHSGGRGEGQNREGKEGD